MALQGLTATRAAIVQLSVPVIAAAGGIALLAETLSSRLAIASFLILGGIAASMTARGKKARESNIMSGHADVRGGDR